MLKYRKIQTKQNYEWYLSNIEALRNIKYGNHRRNSYKTSRYNKEDKSITNEKVFSTKKPINYNTILKMTKEKQTILTTNVEMTFDKIKVT